MVGDLPSYLQPGDVVVVNDTKVFAARLLGHREPSGGAVECLLLRRVDGVVWEKLMHPGQKLKPGARVRFEGPAGVLQQEDDGRPVHPLTEPRSPGLEGR